MGESNFATGRIAPEGTYRNASGMDTTPRGLIGFTADVVPTIMSWQEWNALPSLSARDQLGYVYKVFRANMDHYLGGRPYNSAYELYVSNALPAALSPSGSYSNPDAPLYTGRFWADNLGLDSWPNNLQRQAMLRGEVPEMQQNPLAYAHKLVTLGLLHGAVTMGDLQRYVSRMNGKDPNAAGWAGNPARWALAWNLALRRFLETVRAPAEASPKPEFVPAVYETTSSASGPAFQFDDSMPGSPGSASLTPPPRSGSSISSHLRSGSFRQAPLLGSDWLGVAVGVGILVAIGAAVAYARA